ncbi:MAG TPA: hypothetical protein VK535_10885, partial [Gemmatimonadales bacterium]|nr:hypothetical protein [Gemmatimonadales bacterium]
LDDDGDYFTWTRDEAAAVLDPDELEVAAAYYDIGTAGEMQHDPGKNVLFVYASTSNIALRTGRTLEATERLLQSAQEKLRAARARRPAPFVDRTRYTNWNAMMVSALLRAAAVLDDEWARDHALRSLARIREESAEPDAVAHTPGGMTGLLDDQVQIAAAALDAYELTGQLASLDWSERVMDRAWVDYWDNDAGGLFDTARGRDSDEGLLPARAKPVQDTPTPSPNGVAGIVVARLHQLTGAARWKERGAALVSAFAGRAEELGLHAAAYLLAVDWQVNPATHLVIVGDPGDPTSATMHRSASAGFLPRRVVQLLSPADAQSRPLPAALRGMASNGSSPRGYACVGTSCSRPAKDAASWTATLESLHSMVPA